MPPRSNLCRLKLTSTVKVEIIGSNLTYRGRDVASQPNSMARRHGKIACRSRCVRAAVSAVAGTMGRPSGFAAALATLATLSQERGCAGLNLALTSIQTTFAVFLGKTWLIPLHLRPRRATTGWDASLIIWSK